MSDERKPPRVEILGGDGLHNRVRYWYDDDEDGGLARTLDQFLEGFFWRKLERQLAECDEILRAAGYEKGAYPCGDGVADPYSEAWYAGQVGLRCHLVLDRHRDGREDSEMMLAQIMEIGRLCAEWTWRLSYRPSILTGAKVRRGSAQGGLGRKGALEPGTNQVLEEMARLVESGKKVKEAAEILARKGTGASAAANRQAWYRHRKL